MTSARTVTPKRGSSGSGCCRCFPVLLLCTLSLRAPACCNGRSFLPWLVLLLILLCGWWRGRHLQAILP
jgi:hypothetical protein